MRMLGIFLLVVAIAAFFGDKVPFGIFIGIVGATLVVAGAKQEVVEW